MSALAPNHKPRTILVCHEGAVLNRQGLSRWLADWSDLVGIIVLREKSPRKKRRIKREFRRVGAWRMLDVLAFRLYYRVFMAASDQAWEKREVQRLESRYAAIPSSTPTLTCASINSKSAEEFIRAQAPDMMIARCKQLVRKRIYSLPTSGTFVFHPGICPRYRNAHGCFWALAENDDARVGMTLLQVDDGIDTGPTYGYFSYDFDAAVESHQVIQHRVVLENLPDLAKVMISVFQGTAQDLMPGNEDSATWGQPWLSKFLKWRRRARKAAR